MSLDKVAAFCDGLAEPSHKRVPAMSEIFRQPFRRVTPIGIPRQDRSPSRCAGAARRIDQGFILRRGAMANELATVSKLAATALKVVEFNRNGQLHQPTEALRQAAKP